MSRFAPGTTAAIEQGVMASQEDVAQALKVSVRTVKRDKAEIIGLYEQGMDEADIARQSNHAQSSVGRYLRDYERVKLLLRHAIPIERIGLLSVLQPTIVNAYVKLIEQYQPDLLPTSDLVPDGS